MRIFKIALIHICISLLFTSCSTGKATLNTEIKNDFTKAMNAYQEIWRTKELDNAKKLAMSAFTNNEIVTQVLDSYKASLDLDQGINFTEKSYNISVVDANNATATLKVRANLKGYPISLSTGYKKVNQEQDFSFGPHNFEMKKEQGRWKISKF